jgi:hypothetical protein
MPEIKFTFLQICEHRVADSILIIKLNDILKEHLLNLKKEFFKVNLDSFLKLNPLINYPTFRANSIK